MFDSTEMEIYYKPMSPASIMFRQIFYQVECDAGKLVDGEMEQQYNTFRYYDTGISRFITQSPTG